MQAARRQAQRRAAWLLGRLRLRQCLEAWRSLVGLQERKERMAAAANALRLQRLLHNTLGGWRYLARFWRAAKEAQSGRELRLQAAVLQVRSQHLHCSELKHVVQPCKCATSLPGPQSSGSHPAHKRLLRLQAWRHQAGLTAARRGLLAALEKDRADRLQAQALCGWLGFVEGRRTKLLHEDRDRWAWFACCLCRLLCGVPLACTAAGMHARGAL